MKYYLRKLRAGYLQLFAVDPSETEEYKSKYLAYRHEGGVWILFLMASSRGRIHNETIDIPKEEAAMILFSARKPA